MKKIILLFTALFAFTFVNAQEQSKSQKADVKGRSVIVTQKMMDVLGLSEEQKTKAFRINYEDLKLADLNQEVSGNNPSAFETEQKRIAAKWEKEMSTVITPEQMTKWKTHIAEEKAKSTK